MRICAILPLTALGCAFASPAHAAYDVAPVVLEPSSPWNVDFAQDKCRLLRTFGEEGNRHLLSFEQIGPRTGFGFMVAGPQLERFRSANITIRFGEHPTIDETMYLTGALEKFGPALIYSSLNFAPYGKPRKHADTAPVPLQEIDVSLAEKVGAVNIRKGNREVVFNTGNLADAVKVLNQCSQDLLASWGLDLERHRSATRLPTLKDEPKITRSVLSVIPERALRDLDQGMIRMRVIVDEAGKVAECKTIEATADNEPNFPYCKAMQQATFNPALDRDGRPFRSFYLASFAFSSQ